jgi:hypothetical protein
MPWEWPLILPIAGAFGATAGVGALGATAGVVVALGAAAAAAGAVVALTAALVLGEAADLTWRTRMPWEWPLILPMAGALGATAGAAGALAAAAAGVAVALAAALVLGVAAPLIWRTRMPPWEWPDMPFPIAFEAGPGAFATGTEDMAAGALATGVDAVVEATVAFAGACLGSVSGESPNRAIHDRRRVKGNQGRAS